MQKQQQSPSKSHQENISMEDWVEVDQNGPEGVVKDRSEDISEEGEAVEKVKKAVQNADLMEKTLDGLVDVCKPEEGSTQPFNGDRCFKAPAVKKNFY